MTTGSDKNERGHGDDKKSYDRGYRDAQEGRYNPPNIGPALWGDPSPKGLSPENEAYKSGYRKAQVGKLQDADRLIREPEVAGGADTIGKDEAEAAAAFEAVAANLLNLVDETLADLRREGKETRAVLARLEMNLAGHG